MNFCSIKNWIKKNIEKLISKNSSGHWLMIATTITSLIGIFLSVFLFIFSAQANKATSNFFNKGIFAIRFDNANAALKTFYTGPGIHHAWWSWLIFTEQPFDTIAQNKIKTIEDYDRETYLAPQIISETMDSLQAKKNFWETMENIAFFLLVFVQIINLWFTTRLTYLGQQKIKNDYDD